MRTQVMTHAIIKSNGAVTQIGRGYIMRPAVNFKGGEIRWLPERMKEGVAVGKN